MKFKVRAIFTTFDYKIVENRCVYGIEKVGGGGGSLSLTWIQHEFLQGYLREGLPCVIEISYDGKYLTFWMAPNV